VSKAHYFYFYHISLEPNFGSYIYNSQKTNVDASWREVSNKKRNRNRSKMSTPRKQPKVNRYQPSKFVPTTNSFNGLEEELDDANKGMEKSWTLLIFVARINNFSSFVNFNFSLLKEVVVNEYKIKIIYKQIKIQLKSSIYKYCERP